MTKKQKEQRKKRIKSLILLLFLTVVMLSTSTYAWFTANKSVGIDPIDVYVAASNGLQISATAKADAWKTVLSVSDLANPTGWSAHKNRIASGTANSLVPVSTDGEAHSGYLHMFKGTVEGANISGSNVLALTASRTPVDLTDPSNPDYTEYASSTTDFIAFDIFLKLDGNDASAVYLSDGSGVMVTQHSPAYDDKGLQNAARIALVQEGSASPVATVSADDGAGIRSSLASGTTHAIVIEANADQHNATGQAQALNPYGQTTGTGTGNATLAYKGVNSAISSPIALTSTTASTTDTHFSSINTLIPITTAYTAQTIARSGSNAENRAQLFTLQPGVTKFRVYMWIEGQDVDCENNASGANLTFKIGFTLNQNDNA